MPPRTLPILLAAGALAAIAVRVGRAPEGRNNQPGAAPATVSYHFTAQPSYPRAMLPMGEKTPSFSDPSSMPESGNPTLPTPPASPPIASPVDDSASAHPDNQPAPDLTTAATAEAAHNLPATAPTNPGQSPALSSASPDPIEIGPSSTLLDPATPGSVLTAGNTTVQVEAITPRPGQSAPALHLLLQDAPASSVPPSYQDQPIRESQPSPSHPTAAAGFTYQEEIFRTKWGWAAFDAARRAALDPSPATP